MDAHKVSTIDLGFRDVGFGLLSLVSIALTLIAQFMWMILFDITGLDVYAPDMLFMHILPALTLALIPGVAAQSLYTQKAARITGIIVFIASIVVSLFTIQAFMI